jgi:hypothetical protein
MRISDAWLLDTQELNCIWERQYLIFEENYPDCIVHGFFNVC